MNWLDNVKRFQALSRKSCTRKRSLERTVKISHTHRKKLARGAINGRKSAPPTKHFLKVLVSAGASIGRGGKQTYLFPADKACIVLHRFACVSRSASRVPFKSVCHLGVTRRRFGKSTNWVTMMFKVSKKIFREKVRRWNKISHSILNERKFQFWRITILSKNLI